MNYIDSLKKHAIRVPDILLPKKTIDLSKWAVIACDQYTQDQQYWQQVEKNTQNTPSTYSLIFPEVYLDSGDRNSRIKAIHSAMRHYSDPAKGDVFDTVLHGCIYLERTTEYGRTRKGLVTAIDLESYDWHPNTTALIRATEATIEDRIPPRMEIRRGAPLESPHIMLLINDPDKGFVEKTGDQAKRALPRYEATLEPNAGYITGWKVSSDKVFTDMASALSTIAKENTASDGSCFLFAVGDGNHSLATAKAVWEEFRDENNLSEADAKNHPARYALVEIVNIYDEGLTFEPIHRVLFGANHQDLTTFVQEKLGGKLLTPKDDTDLEKQVSSKETTCFGFISNEKKTVLQSPHPTLAVSRLQPILDEYLDTHPEIKIDYIHGTDEVFRLGKSMNALAILLPPVEKNSFFSSIASTGPLPRKSFSMGEASEKRYYMECRRLFD